MPDLSASEKGVSLFGAAGDKIRLSSFFAVRWKWAGDCVHQRRIALRLRLIRGAINALPDCGMERPAACTHAGSMGGDFFQKGFGVEIENPVRGDPFGAFFEADGVCRLINKPVQMGLDPMLVSKFLIERKKEVVV